MFSYPSHFAKCSPCPGFQGPGPRSFPHEPKSSSGQCHLSRTNLSKENLKAPKSDPVVPARIKFQIRQFGCFRTRNSTGDPSTHTHTHTHTHFSSRAGHDRTIFTVYCRVSVRVSAIARPMPCEPPVTIATARASIAAAETDAVHSWNVFWSCLSSSGTFQKNCVEFGVLCLSRSPCEKSSQSKNYASTTLLLFIYLPKSGLVSPAIICVTNFVLLQNGISKDSSFWQVLQPRRGHDARNSQIWSNMFISFHQFSPFAGKE